MYTHTLSNIIIIIAHRHTHTHTHTHIHYSLYRWFAPGHALSRPPSLGCWATSSLLMYADDIVLMAILNYEPLGLRGQPTSGTAMFRYRHTQVLAGQAKFSSLNSMHNLLSALGFAEEWRTWSILDADANSWSGKAREAVERGSTVKLFAWHRRLRWRLLWPAFPQCTALTRPCMCHVTWLAAPMCLEHPQDQTPSWPCVADGYGCQAARLATGW